MDDEHGHEISATWAELRKHAMYSAVFIQAGGLSNSALPSFIVTYLNVSAVEGEGVGVDSRLTSLISRLILRDTASSTAPGALSAISLTSRRLRVSLMREARDCRSIVVGPSKRRNNRSP